MYVHRAHGEDYRRDRSKTRAPTRLMTLKEPADFIPTSNKLSNGAEGWVVEGEIEKL